MASVEELSGKYRSQISSLKSIFPDWDDGDLAFTLQDAKGSVDDAVLMITEGELLLCTECHSREARLTPSLLLSPYYRPSIPIHLCVQEKGHKAKHQGRPHRQGLFEQRRRHGRLGRRKWRWSSWTGWNAWWPRWPWRPGRW